MHHASSEMLMPVAKPGQVIVIYKGECPKTYHTSITYSGLFTIIRNKYSKICIIPGYSPEETPPSSQLKKKFQYVLEIILQNQAPLLSTERRTAMVYHFAETGTNFGEVDSPTNEWISVRGKGLVHE